MHVPIAALAVSLAFAPLATAQNQGITLVNTVDGYADVPYSPQLVPQSGITVEAWITYDDVNLYVGATAEEPAPEAAAPTPAELMAAPAGIETIVIRRVERIRAGLCRVEFLCGGRGRRDDRRPRLETRYRYGSRYQPAIRSASSM